ncbi:MAG TPA: peptidase M16 [Rhodospirillaceae bacterium]|nr:peptidase M16 [Rhodospirillaceae bacterium]
MKKTLGVLCVWAALSSPTTAHAAVFYPESATLANGLQVVVIQNKLSPAAVQMVWYKVGAADDPQGRGGLAHFFEHMMFKGTAALPDGAYSEQIAAQGGDDNAFTSHDYTSYHEIVAADRLPLVMQMEADRMRGLILDDEKASSELSVVKSERQQRIDNHPQGLFGEKFRAALFPAHPYGRPVIGSKEDLDRLTPADARAFYQKHYAPQNAILVVSGNVEFADVLRLAAATFGRVEGNTAITDRAPIQQNTPSSRGASDRIEMQDARVTQPMVMASVPAPSLNTNLRRSYALEVLAEILGGGEVGLLYRHFVTDQKIASSASVSYDPTARGPSSFSWSAVPSASTETRALEKQIKEWLAQKASTGIDAATVARAKQRLQDAAIFARDRLAAPAQIVGEALAVGIPLNELESWPQRIHSVTAAEVNAAFRDVMKSQGWVTGILEPAK